MSQQDRPEDQAFAQKLRKALRESETVDAATAARLRQARARAMAAVPSTMADDWGRRLNWALPAGAAVAALLLVTVLQRPQPPIAPALADAHGAEALDLLTDDMDPQFYRDLEFYKWLEHQRHA